jgi:hypothetical protein
VRELVNAVFTRQFDADRLKELERAAPPLWRAWLTIRGGCAVPLLSEAVEWSRARGMGGDVGQAIERALDRIRRRLLQKYETPEAHFLIQYETVGPDRVDPDGSAETVTVPYSDDRLGELLRDEVPTYVRRLGLYLEHALRVYTRRFPSMPPPVQPVTVVLNSSITMPAGRDTILLRTLAGREILFAYASHELFHLFQNGFPQLGQRLLGIGPRGAGTWGKALFEGGAVMAEDAPADRLNRYLFETGTLFHSDGILGDPNQTLYINAYKAAILWRYLAERSRRPSPDEPDWALFGDLYARLQAAPTTGRLEAAIRDVLPDTAGFHFARIVGKRGQEILHAETVLGNLALACYLSDPGVSHAERRFRFAEAGEGVEFLDALAQGEDPERERRIGRVSLTGPLRLGRRGAAFRGHVNLLGSRFIEVDLDPAMEAVEVAVRTTPPVEGTCLVQLVLLGPANAVLDIVRAEGREYTRRVALGAGKRRTGRLVIVISGVEPDAGLQIFFEARIRPARAAPDVMITRWNCRRASSYEIDPLEGWTWTSPDLWVGPRRAERGGTTIEAGKDNPTHVRVHNRGARPARADVELWYQAGEPAGLRGDRWRRVTDRGGRTQTARIARVPGGGRAVGTVQWCPPADLAGQPVCFRAVARTPGDPNADGKRAMSRFECVPFSAPRSNPRRRASS